MKWLSHWLSRRKKGAGTAAPAALPSSANSPQVQDCFVGRERELRQLQGWLASAEKREGQLWLIRGEAGMGKSELCTKFFHRCLVDGQHIIARATCDEMATQVGMAPVIRLLQSLILTTEKSAGAANDLAEIVLAGIQHTPLLQELMSVLPDTSALASRFGNTGLPLAIPDEGLLPLSPQAMYYDLTTVLKKVASRHPLLLQLDDCQWCDASSVQFLTFFCQRITRLPIVAILCYRENDAASENGPLVDFLRQARQQANTRCLTLEPLADDEVETFLARRFPGRRLSDDLTRRFVKATGGIPLFFCETACLLEEDGWLAAQGDTSQQLRDMSESRMPISMEEAARERIRRLETQWSQDQRDAIETASVQGEQSFARVFQQTVEKDWRPPSPESRYSFSCAMYRKIVYGRLSEPRKRNLHQAVAEAMEKTSGASVASCLATHFTAARQFSSAAHYSHLAALRELRLGSAATAGHYAQHGLACVQKLEPPAAQDRPLEARLHILLGTCYAAQGKLDQAGHALQTARSCAQACNDISLLPEIFYRLCLVKRERGALHTAENQLLEALRVSDELGDRQWRIRLLCLQGEICHSRSRWHEAEKSLLEALQCSTQERWWRLRIQVLSELARLQETENKWQQALATLEQRLDVARVGQDNIAQAQAIYDIAHIYRRQGRWNDGVVRCRQALSLFQQSQHTQGEAECELVLALLTLKQGDWNKALEILSRCRERYEEMAYRQGIADVFDMMGHALRKLCRYQEACVCHEKSLAIDSEAKNDEGKAFCLQQIACLEMRFARWDNAKRMLEQAAGMWKKMRAEAEYSSALAHLGRLFGRQSQFATALNYLEQSLAIKDRIGDSAGKACVLDEIGFVHLRQCRWEAANKAFRESLCLRRELGIGERQAVTLSLLGHLQLRQGKFDKAVEHYVQSLNINNDVGDREGAASVSEYIGVACLVHGRLAEALTRFQESLSRREQLEDRRGIASIHGWLGKLYRQQGDHVKALSHWRQSLDIYRQLADIAGEARILNDIGRLHYLAGHQEEAWACFVDALGLCEKTADLYVQGKVHNNMGTLLLRSNKALEAMEQFAHSQEIKETIQDVRGLIFTYCDTAEAYIQLNRLDKAIENYQRALPACELFADDKRRASIYCKLGELCQREGKHKEARLHYEQAIVYYSANDGAMEQQLTAHLEELEDA